MILLTRPAPLADEFADLLRAGLGAVDVVISPLLTIGWVPVEFTGDATPIFTSRNGVEGFLRAGGVARGDCWCVGGATAEAAQAAGFVAQAAEGDAVSLIARILGSGDRGPFMHYRGQHARGSVAEKLNAAGRETGETVVYTQNTCDLSNEAKACLGGETPVIIPLFSPRTAAQFCRVAIFNAPLYAAVMSAAVAAELEPMRLTKVEIAERPDAAAMFEVTEGLFKAVLRLEGDRGTT